MKTFLVLYSGGKAPTTPEEGEASKKAWTEWFEDLGEAVVEAGAPLAEAKTVSSSGVQEGSSDNISNGYSLLQADDLAGVAELVEDCPIIAEGGKVHVFDLVSM